MPEKRHSTHTWLYRALALAGVVLLAACGGGSRPNAPLTGENGYLLTVPAAGGDSPESLAQKYGGEVIAWLEDKAILKLSTQAATALSERGVSLQRSTLEPNTKVSTPARALGFNSWAGGFNSWAGGWNSWAGGWNSWAGGNTIPTLPGDNRKEFTLSKLPQGHAIARRYGQAVVVAVIDTGIDLQHPIFQGRLDSASRWRDFVDGDTTPQEVTGTYYGHGTGVAGVIVQVAPRATILPIRVLGPDGMGETANVIAAIDHAVRNGANVINLSLGTSSNSDALQLAIANAAAQGVHVVASAGNEATGSLTFPAALGTSVAGNQYVISVGSASTSGDLSSFSNFGPALEMLAPGEGIVSAYPDLRLAGFTGTSFAAPIVSGLVAVARSDGTASGYGSIEAILKNGLRPTPSGYGIVNGAETIRNLVGYQAKRALFVAASTTLYSSDAELVRRLQRLGYSVTVVDDDLLTSSQVSNQAVVLYSSSASANASMLRNVTVPVVTWRGDQLSTLGMVATSSRSLTTFGSASRQTSLQLRTMDHPLNAGMDASPIVYRTGDMATWGVPSSSASWVFTVSGDVSKATVFGYASGDPMAGLNAPARRVGLFLGNSSNLTGEGWDLFDAAITWAVSGN